MSEPKTVVIPEDQGLKILEDFITVLGQRELGRKCYPETSNYSQNLNVLSRTARKNGKLTQKAADRLRVGALNSRDDLLKLQEKVNFLLSLYGDN